MKITHANSKKAYIALGPRIVLLGKSITLKDKQPINNHASMVAMETNMLIFTIYKLINFS